MGADLEQPEANWGAGAGVGQRSNKLNLASGRLHGQRARMDVKEAVETLMKVRGWTKTRVAHELGEARREITKWTSPTNPKGPGPKVTKRVLAKVRALLDDDQASGHAPAAPETIKPTPAAEIGPVKTKAKAKPTKKIFLNDEVPSGLPMQELGGGIRPYVH